MKPGPDLSAEASLSVGMAVRGPCVWSVCAANHEQLSLRCVWKKLVGESIPEVRLDGFDFSESERILLNGRAETQEPERFQGQGRTSPQKAAELSR